MLIQVNCPGNAWTYVSCLPECASGRVGRSGPVCADNGEVLRASAVAGLGVTLLPTYIVGDDLKAGSFVEFLADYSGSHPGWGI